MGLRHLLARYLPSWLGDQHGEATSIPPPPAPGHSYGYRTLWSAALLVDVQLEVFLQASLAAVGRGTPTALKYLERARGVTRGRLDTDATYAKKLPTWVDRAKTAGSQRGLARELADYLGECRVRVINRAGHWVTVEASGALSEVDAPWDWDSVSHPERAGFVSDMWVVVYAPPSWVNRAGTLGALTGDDGYALGHMATMQERDAVLGIVERFKSAHSLVRAIIWTHDATQFSPTDPASRPNGTWGAWGTVGSGSRVVSPRFTNCRYWEPR